MKGCPLCSYVESIEPRIKSLPSVHTKAGQSIVRRLAHYQPRDKFEQRIAGHLLSNMQMPEPTLRATIVTLMFQANRLPC